MADKVDRDARDPKFADKLTAKGKLKGRPRISDMPCAPDDDGKLQTVDIVRFYLAESRPKGTQAWAVRVAEEEARARQPNVDSRKLQLTEKDIKQGWNIVSSKKSAIRKRQSKPR